MKKTMNTKTHGMRKWYILIVSMRRMYTIGAQQTAYAWYNVTQIVPFYIF